MFANDLIDCDFFGALAFRHSLPALRSSRIACAPAGVAQKAALDYPIFERMERDHRQSSSVSERGDSSGDEAFQRSELIVDRDSQGLKRSRSGVYPPSTWNVQRPHDYVGKLLCGSDDVAGACPRDRPRDLARAPFFSIFKDQISQLTLSKLIDQVCGR